MIKHIPNIITLSNLFFGCAAIVCLLDNEPLMAIFFVVIGGIADFLDGFVARALKVKSELGKQLDSLADMVTFGVVPGVIYYTLLLESFQDKPEWGINLFASMGFIASLASGYRLGKFNLDDRQSENFLGMPTPANTILVIGFLLISMYDAFGLAEIIRQPNFLIPAILISSWLMVSEIPMFSLKFKNLNWVENKIRIIFVVLAVLEVSFLGTASVAIIILTYIFLSILTYIFKIK